MAKVGTPDLFAFLVLICWSYWREKWRVQTLIKCKQHDSGHLVYKNYQNLFLDNVPWAQGLEAQNMAFKVFLPLTEVWHLNHKHTDFFTYKVGTERSTHLQGFPKELIVNK